MKKKNILLLVLLICVFITGCGNKTKEVTTIDIFNDSATKNGFTVKDNINDYKSDTYITSATLAKYNDDIRIEMVVYDNEENAIKVQDEQIKQFRLLRNTGSGVEKKDKGKNYYKYFLISNNFYMISSRVDNTLIFCKTPLDNKEKVENILNDTGY